MLPVEEGIYFREIVTNVPATALLTGKCRCGDLFGDLDHVPESKGAGVGRHWQRNIPDPFHGPHETFSRANHADANSHDLSQARNQRRSLIG